MEQPWPPPGPWNLPRSEGEAEEESDLDVSPSSPRCPQLPDGGAQVRGARFLQGEGRCGRQVPRVPCDPHLYPVLRPPPHSRELGARCHSTAIVASSKHFGEGLAIYFQPLPPCTSHLGRFPLTLGRRPPPPPTRVPILSAPRLGAGHAITSTLCPLVRAFIREFYSVEDILVHSDPFTEILT